MRCNIGSLKSSYEIRRLLGILQIIGSMIFPYAHWNVKTIKNGLDSTSSNYSANCLWGKILFALFSDPSQEVEIFSRFYSKQAYKHIILLWILYKIVRKLHSYLLNCFERPYFSFYVLLQYIKRRRYIPKINEFRWKKSCITIDVSVADIWYDLIAIPMSLLWFNAVRKTKPLNRCAICI